VYRKELIHCDTGLTSANRRQVYDELCGKGHLADYVYGDDPASVNEASNLRPTEYCGFTLYNEISTDITFNFPAGIVAGPRLFMKQIGANDSLSWVRADDWDIKTYKAVDYNLATTLAKE
jgi:hypothetical protein